MIGSKKVSPTQPAPEGIPEAAPEAAAPTAAAAAAAQDGAANPGAATETTETAEGTAATAATAQPANDELIAQNQALLADLQRTRADFENFRKQVDLQREQAKRAAAEATVAKMLPLLDNVDRALTTYPEQLAPLTKSFTAALSDLGLAKLDTAPDTPFDPDCHEAVMVEGDGDREVIAETLRPGYTYQGEVLRAAMVKVKRVD